MENSYFDNFLLFLREISQFYKKYSLNSTLFIEDILENYSYFEIFTT